MKKVRILAILMCLVMLGSVVAGCNGGDKGGADSTSTSSTDTTAATTGDTGATTTTNDAGSNQGNTATGKTPVKDTLTVVATTDYGTLAHENTAGELFHALGLVNEPLWAQFKLLPEIDDVEFLLAESFEKVSTTEWILHLKEGIKFSNGSPFACERCRFFNS